LVENGDCQHSCFAFFCGNATCWQILWAVQLISAFINLWSAPCTGRADWTGFGAAGGLDARLCLLPLAPDQSPLGRTATRAGSVERFAPKLRVASCGSPGAPPLAAVIWLFDFVRFIRDSVDKTFY